MTHIHHATEQPATRFAIEAGGTRRTWIKFPARHPLWCRKCRRKRWAANLTAQVYYDGTYFSCKPGKGCKAGR